jgi:hypothetical protein
MGGVRARVSLFVASGVVNCEGKEKEALRVGVF